MSKRSKLALILAMMLGASAVIAACDDGGMTSSPDSSSGSSTQTPAEEEAAANDIYKERIEKWLQYVEYDAPEAVAKATLTARTDKDTDNVKTTVGMSGDWKQTKIYKTFKEEVANPDFDATLPDDEDPTTNPETIEQDVEKLTETVEEETFYAEETGAKIATFTSRTFVTTIKTETISEVEVDKTVLLDDTKKKSDEVRYQANTSFHSVFLEVKKTEYVLKEVEDDPATEDVDESQLNDTWVENYEAVETYSYYNKLTGEAVATDLEEPAVVRGDLVDVDGKTYAFDEDGVAKVFELGMEYNLPTFDKNSTQANGYVYFEQGDYGYVIDEANFVAGAQVGDLVMGILPGLSVQVYKDYELVAQYETDSSTDLFSVMGYTILPNGNVYVCEYRQLSDSATAYDLLFDTVKLDVVHTVLDVTTGETKEVANGFVAQKVFSNVTEELNTILNLNTVTLDNYGTRMEGVTVKDGYILAEIQTYSDGALQGNSAFAVLDANTLEKVAELPKIVDSQFGYAGFVSKNEMLVNVLTAEKNIVRYTANVETGDLELFKKTSNGVQFLEKDTFLYGDKIYDFTWSEIADLTDVYSSYDTLEVEVLDNGKLLITYTEAEEYSTYSYEAMQWYIGEIKEESHYDYAEEKDVVTKTFQKTQLASNTWYSYQENSKKVSIEYKGNFFVYRENGAITKLLDFPNSSYSYGANVLMENTEETKYVYETDYSYKYVTYDVETKIVSLTELSDGSYLVKVEESWTKDNDYGYSYSEEDVPSQEVLSKDGKTYYQYYILK